MNRDSNYPKEFVKVPSKLGYLGCFILKKIQESRQKLRTVAIILEEIHPFGGNDATFQAQMYIMETLLRYGSNDQKKISSKNC